ncbi:hypothetical protein A4X06_0g1549 [Tilletia controversa]|uniref:Tr-type G domain-containing protein n=1 Tax=Tilletia controversa TaxID=13291 RepID=A0A8X7SZP0_9BASI|nr:hypothetical protein CF335_g3970 [Tilletia laevis]KAE8253311.1 hypothetical protein A4X06_0g1549 [Tilletia controversa]
MISSVSVHPTALSQEFGNYIGADLDSDLEDDDEHALQLEQQRTAQFAANTYQHQPAIDIDNEEDDQPPPLEGYDDNGDGDLQIGAAPTHALIRVDESSSHAVVLHEDKKYYPTANETYGEDVEALVQEEDSQAISVPIIEPVKVRKFAIQEGEGEGGDGVPEARFDREFMANLLGFPDHVRNVAVVGGLHHGKTSLMDMLLFESHRMEINMDKDTRYTDATILERQRGISTKTSPLTLVLPTTHNKSYLFNLLDTPGHPNFQDEVAASVRLSDGVLLVVDVVEGVMASTEHIIRHVIRQGLPIVLVVNKVDRLILELRLPPVEAYFKIKHTIEQVNALIASLDSNPARRLAPERGNVAFASTQMGWSFTLRSFAKLYAQNNSNVGGRNKKAARFDVDEFAKRLWGNIYYVPSSRKFTRVAPDPEHKRSFVQFILEPLYKLYTHVLSSDTDSLKLTLSKLGIHLKPAVYKMDVRALLRVVLNQFFGNSEGLADVMVYGIPSPKAGALAKVSRIWTGPQSMETSPLFAALANCDPDGPLVIHVTKLFPTSDASGMRAFGRVLSGTVHVGDQVNVLGEGYTQDDGEDLARATVLGVGIHNTRFTLPLEAAPAGSLVLLSGVEANMVKSATVLGADVGEEERYVCSGLDHMTSSVLKVSVEPLNPAELPKMLDGLRKINQTYPLISTKVEESGEHVVLGTGEVMLDSVLHDLRKVFAEIEVKVSDPVVQFRETVVETSAVKCYAQTANKKNKLTIIAEPLEKGIAEDIESGRVHIRMPPKQLGKHFQEKYDWDLLASRSIWAFGPEENGPNILMDDTLPSEVDKKLLYNVRESIRQGFQWATREGPLCDEPIRNVKFRILDAQVAPDPISRGGGQIIPASRRVCYSSLLLATPRLMEPVYFVEVQTPPTAVDAVYKVLARRRGHVVQDIPQAGSPLSTVKAYLPVMDANGFETDLRALTQGQAFCVQIFDHWQVVPGDPLDKGVVLRPLEPAPPLGLARDFVLKVRRRKGLSDAISVNQYLDSEMVVALASSFDLS